MRKIENSPISQQATGMIRQHATDTMIRPDPKIRPAHTTETMTAHARGATTPEMNAHFNHGTGL